jgi:hypothetical protein
MPEAGRDGRQERRNYALFVRRDGGGFLMLADEGVALDGERLSWTIRGAERSRPLGEVRGVHLFVAHVPEYGDYGTCEIRFDGPELLLVTASSTSGFPDDERNPVYAAFVRDLHGALAARPAKAIRFSAGASEGRLQGMRVLLVILSLLFVALPLALLVWSGDLKLLAGAMLGAIVVAGGYAWMQKNRPRDYDPQRVPQELLP